MTAVAVAIGGALGAVARYFLAVKLYPQLGIDFPWGTFAVNILGCAILGVVIGLIEERGTFSPQMRTAITVGLIGGFTTFSTFVYEYWQFLRDGEPVRAVFYVVISLAVGLVAFTLARAAVIQTA